MLLWALIWRPKLLQNYPMAIGLALICIFLPFIFLGNTGGYPPRYSIHLLPLALLSLTIVTDNIFKKIVF